MHVASIHGHSEVVRLLLSQDGIDVNKRGIDVLSATPLFATGVLMQQFVGGAVGGDHAAVIRLLLGHGDIDTNKGKIEGDTSPLASNSNRPNIFLFSWGCNGCPIRRLATYY